MSILPSCGMHAYHRTSPESLCITSGNANRVWNAETNPNDNLYANTADALDLSILGACRLKHTQIKCGIAD